MKLSLGKYSWCFVVALIFALCLLPATVLGVVTHSVQTNYDANGDTTQFGEEIAVKLTVDPGDTGITNLTIALQDDQAFIDPSSFETIIASTAGSGSRANIVGTDNPKTFFVANLKPGEKAILSFSAYPKTARINSINAANTRLDYTQLGQHLSESVSIPATMTSSSWFALQNQNNGSLVLWIILIAVIIIVLFMIFTFRAKTVYREFLRQLNSLHKSFQEIQGKTKESFGNQSTFDELLVLEEEFDKKMVTLMRSKGKINHEKSKRAEHRNGNGKKEADSNKIDLE